MSINWTKHDSRGTSPKFTWISLRFMHWLKSQCFLSSRVTSFSINWPWCSMNSSVFLCSYRNNALHLSTDEYISQEFELTKLSYVISNLLSGKLSEYFTKYLYSSLYHFWSYPIVSVTGIFYLIIYSNTASMYYWATDLSR